MKKVRICHIITRMIIGGAQENTLLTVEGLMRRGYDVDLITGPPIGPEGSLLDRCYENGVNVIQVDELRRNLNPFADIKALLALVKILKENKYDIVHTHSSKAGILGRVAAKLAGVPVIIHTIHGLPFHEYEKKTLNIIYKLLESRAASFTGKIIVVCPEMMNKAVAAGIGKRNIYEVVYSGIEIEKYFGVAEANVPFSLSDHYPVIGKVARLFPLKGHDDLVPIAKNVVKKYPNAKFVLVGDGILRKKLEERLKREGLFDNFYFAGLVNPDDIPSYIKAFDMTIHLSLREGLARVIPQSFLLKKPVISYDIDGAKDVIDDGKNGYLVKPSDTDTFVRRIIDLADNKIVASEFGERGYRKAVSLFSSEKMVDDIEKIYKKFERESE